MSRTPPPIPKLIPISSVAVSATGAAGTAGAVAAGALVVVGGAIILVDFSSRRLCVDPTQTAVSQASSQSPVLPLVPGVAATAEHAGILSRRCRCCRWGNFYWWTGMDRIFVSSSWFFHLSSFLSIASYLRTVGTRCLVPKLHCIIYSIMIIAWYKCLVLIALHHALFCSA